MANVLLRIRRVLTYFNRIEYILNGAGAAAGSILTYPHLKHQPNESDAKDVGMLIGLTAGFFVGLLIVYGMLKWCIKKLCCPSNQQAVAQPEQRAPLLDPATIQPQASVSPPGGPGDVYQPPAVTPQFAQLQQPAMDSGQSGEVNVTPTVSESPRQAQLLA